MGLSLCHFFIRLTLKATRYSPALTSITGGRSVTLMRDTTLSTDQTKLLGHLLAASEVAPGTPHFHCGRLRRIGFTWITHDGFERDVRVAHWDDVLALERQDLIELEPGANDSDDCTFVLTACARQFADQYQTAPCSYGGVIPSVDSDTSNFG